MVHRCQRAPGRSAADGRVGLWVGL